jgi:hypothetical protein
LRSNGGGRLAGDVVRSGGRGWKVLQIRRQSC